MSGYFGRILATASTALLLAAGVGTSAFAASQPVAGCPASDKLLTVREAVNFYYDLGGTEAPDTLVPFINGIDTPGVDPTVDDKTKGNGDGYVCIRENSGPNNTINISDNKVRS
ncbi:hypothetical protein [Streptomyces sp. NPDC096030]|uniref:hypothetical protein n=1 Tax=Streptomyces sp. NPDC096030 TaxID=3155423 RepID=UPI0033250D14